MKIRYLVLAAPTLLILPQLGCSSSGSGSGGSGTCSASNPITPTCKALDYTSIDSAASSAAAVSFKDAIFTPIIRPTCTSVACHGTPLTQKTSLVPAAGLYLGPLPSDTVTTIDAALLAQIWGELQRSSTTTPSMKIVVPMDPANSFLMLKLSGCQNTKSLTCTVQSPSLSETMTGCGDTMPPSCFAQTNDLTLTDAQIATFATWIAQGANNN